MSSAWESSSGYGCTEVIGNQVHCSYCSLNVFSFDLSILELWELRRTFVWAASLRNVVPRMFVIPFQSPFGVTGDEINEFEVFILCGLWWAKWHRDEFESEHASYTLSLSFPFSAPNCCFILLPSTLHNRYSLKSWHGFCFEGLFLSVLSSSCVAVYPKWICLRVACYWKTTNFCVRSEVLWRCKFRLWGYRFYKRVVV